MRHAIAPLRNVHHRVLMLRLATITQTVFKNIEDAIVDQDQLRDTAPDCCIVAHSFSEVGQRYRVNVLRNDSREQ
jgi:hypothetical protein